MTYIYAFTTALIVKQQVATVEMTRQLNDRFTEPQKTREVKRTAKDAYKDAITFFDAYVKNNCEMKELPRNLIKPMKNTTVLDKLNLNLTQGEKEHLSTLLDKAESQRRDTVRKRVKRREQGVKPRGEYLGKKEGKLKQLKEALINNPKATNKELATLLQTSIRQIQRYKQEVATG
ncbi:hypothetical protein CDB3_32015 [Bacillus sp. CDB3]|nr:hypothetical protein CDB3_32015 [Bacillus sp. CDB3]